MDCKMFNPQVIDETGKRRERFNALHKKTKIQKRQLAAEIMDIGLAELERRIKSVSNISFK